MIIKERVKRTAGNPAFVKGRKGTSPGRPKGAYNNTTLRFVKLKELASIKADEAFNMLWGAMERGESWAHQIYFKELYTIPRNHDDKKVTIEDANPTVEGQIKVLTEILPKFDEVTHQESIERLKALNSVKTNEHMQQHNEEIRETRESLLEKVDLIQKVVEMKREVENDDA